MAEPIHQLGNNTELDEDSNGDTVLRNTASGTEIKLTNFIDIIGGSLGESGNPIPGTSFFDSLNAIDSVSKVRSDEVVYAGHPDFSSPQDADTFAVNNDHHVVEVPQGDYGQLKPSSNIKIVGLPSEIAGPSNEQALFSPDGASAVAIENDRSVVESVAVEGGTPGAGSPHHGFNVSNITFARIENCLINASDGVGIRCDGSRVRLLGNHFRTSDIDAEEVLLTSNSSRCVVDGSSSQGGVTVVNNGTDNVVGDNA